MTDPNRKTLALIEIKTDADSDVCSESCPGHTNQNCGADGSIGYVCSLFGARVFEDQGDDENYSLLRAPACLEAERLSLTLQRRVEEAEARVRELEARLDVADTELRELEIR